MLITATKTIGCTAAELFKYARLLELMKANFDPNLDDEYHRLGIWFEGLPVKEQARIELCVAWGAEETARIGTTQETCDLCEGAAQMNREHNSTGFFCTRHDEEKVKQRQAYIDAQRVLR